MTSLALVLFLLVLVGGGYFHRARAQVSESLFDLGSQMMRYEQARRQDGPRDLIINGQTLRFSSGMADQPLHELLDVFEARCREADGRIFSHLDELRRQSPEAAERPEPESFVMRREHPGQGFVTCIDLGEDEVAPAELVQRLGRFGRTGDVAELGELRFVFGEESGQGDSLTTHFVGMWTSGSFNVRTMFPEGEDVPGRDVADLPRPPGSQRVLSTWERGLPHTLTVYRSDENEISLESFYREALRVEGFELLEVPAAARQVDVPRTLVAERGERMLTFIFQPDLQTGGGSAAIMETR